MIIQIHVRSHKKKLKLKIVMILFLCLVIPSEQWSSGSKHPQAPLWVGAYFWNSSGGVTLDIISHSQGQPIKTILTLPGTGLPCFTLLALPCMAHSTLLSVASRERVQAEPCHYKHCENISKHMQLETSYWGLHQHPP